MPGRTAAAQAAAAAAAAFSSCSSAAMPAFMWQTARSSAAVLGSGKRGMEALFQNVLFDYGAEAGDEAELRGLMAYSASGRL